jgi:DNA-binding MarR family transcriptional regulator
MRKLDPNSRDIIRAINRAGGRATTTEIRRETSLDNSSVRYRYGKLKDAGLIETTKDPDATPEGVAPITVAKLTDKAEKEIEKGLTFEYELQRAAVEPQDNAEQITQLKEELAELRNLVNQLKENQQWIGPQVEQLSRENE